MVTLASIRYGNSPMTVGANHADRFKRFLESLQQSGIRVDPQQSGGFANRNIRGTNTRSQHAHGNAVDVNWTANPEGHVARPPQGGAPFDPSNLVDNAGDRPGQTEIPGEVARALGRRHGLRWGGDFQGRSPDPMHFEVNGPDLSTPSSATTAYPEGPGGPPQAPTQVAGPQAMPHTQGPPQAPFGASMMNNPMLMAGLSILGTTPGQSWGPAAAQAIERAQRSGMQQNEYQRLLNQRQKSERVWNEAFPDGRANMTHPLLRGVPEDLANTVLAMGPDEGLPALQKFALTRSTRGLQDALIQSQIRRNDAQSQSSIQRGQAREMDAETRRRVANYDTFINRFGSGDVTEAQWEEENREGGLIQAVFGRNVPFTERNSAVQQVQSQRDQLQGGGEEPSAEELRAAGVRPEDAARRRQQTVLERMYGSAPRNHRWRADGTTEPIPGYGTQGERQAQTTATQGLSMLTEAEKILGETGTLEALAGDRWFRRPDGTGGIGGFGAAGRGYLAARGAITNLVFALSGKQVSNAERQTFMDIYSPTSLDSKETQTWKLKRVRAFFEAVQAARLNGADDDAIAEMMRRATAEGEAGPNPQSRPSAPTPRSGGGRDNDPLGIR